MNIKQISVFLENKSGRLAEVTRTLSQEGINMRALSLADAADFGVLRIIVNDPDRCLAVLRDRGFVAQETTVIAVEVEDKPGGLDKILAVLDRERINVEYLYAFVERTAQNAMVIIKIDDQERAISVLQKAGVALVSNEVLDNL